MAAVFNALDLDKDGVITRDEWAETFGRLDTNGDGVISRKEWAAMDKDMQIFDVIPRKHLPVISRADWLACFDKADTDKNGCVDKKEWAALHGIADEDLDIPQAPEEFKEAFNLHNQLRAAHGAPPLSWSEECATYAKLQADACAGLRKLCHGNMDGPSGQHGQNAYGSSVSNPPARAVQSWYDEVKDYDYGSPGFAGNTGHFTQVVWVETRLVGMATSRDGRYIIANYLPAGNFTNPGQFERNVLPAGAERVRRAPPPKLGVTTAKEWNDSVAAALAGCPMDDMVEKVRAAFESGEGATVTLTREAGSLKVKVEQEDGSWKSFSGSWH